MHIIYQTLIPFCIRYLRVIYKVFDIFHSDISVFKQNTKSIWHSLSTDTISTISFVMPYFFFTLTSLYARLWIWKFAYLLNPHVKYMRGKIFNEEKKWNVVVVTSFIKHQYTWDGSMFDVIVLKNRFCLLVLVDMSSKFILSYFISYSSFSLHQSA